MSNALLWKRAPSLLTQKTTRFNIHSITPTLPVVQGKVAPKGLCMGEPRVWCDSRISKILAELFVFPEKYLRFGPALASFKSISQFSVTKTGDVRRGPVFGPRFSSYKAILLLWLFKKNPKECDTHGRTHGLDEQTHIKNLRLSIQKPFRAKNKPIIMEERALSNNTTSQFISNHTNIVIAELMKIRNIILKWISESTPCRNTSPC